MMHNSGIAKIDSGVRLRELGERLEEDLRDNPRFRDRETDYGPLVPR
jgi:hypothetical protein